MGLGRKTSSVPAGTGCAAKLGGKGGGKNICSITTAQPDLAHMQTTHVPGSHADTTVPSSVTRPCTASWLSPTTIRSIALPSQPG